MDVVLFDLGVVLSDNPDGHSNAMAPCHHHDGKISQDRPVGPWIIYKQSDLPPFRSWGELCDHLDHPLKCRDQFTCLQSVSHVGQVLVIRKVRREVRLRSSVVQ